MGAWLAPRHGFFEAAESGGAGGHSHGRAAGCGVVLGQVEVRDAARQLRRQAAQVAGAAVYWTGMSMQQGQKRHTTGGNPVTVMSQC